MRLDRLPDWTEFIKSGALFRWNHSEILLFCGLKPSTPASHLEDQPRLFRSPFFSAVEGLHFWEGEAWGRFAVKDVLRWLEPSQGPFVKGELKRRWQPPQRPAFSSCFVEIFQEFERQTLQKVVPVVEEVSPGCLTEAEFRLALWRAVAADHLLAYGMWNSETGVLGATPEVLWEQKEGRTLQTMALAGTRPSMGFCAGALLEDPKERHEHQVVIDDLIGRLSDWGAVTVGETREHNVGALTHLKTEIEVTLIKDFTVSERIEALHPTPALGGAPPAAALEFLSQQPGAQRRCFFGSPLGVDWGRQGTKCVVAIRNVNWSKNQLSVFAGCGVVPQSEEEKEWHELEAKRLSVKQLLGFVDAH